MLWLITYSNLVYSTCMMLPAIIWLLVLFIYSSACPSIQLSMYIYLLTYLWPVYLLSIHSLIFYLTENFFKKMFSKGPTDCEVMVRNWEEHCHFNFSDVGRQYGNWQTQKLWYRGMDSLSEALWETRVAEKEWVGAWEHMLVFRLCVTFRRLKEF